MIPIIFIKSYLTVSVSHFTLFFLHIRIIINKSPRIYSTIFNENFRRFWPLGAKLYSRSLLYTSQWKLRKTDFCDGELLCLPFCACSSQKDLCLVKTHSLELYFHCSTMQGVFCKLKVNLTENCQLKCNTTLDSNLMTLYDLNRLKLYHY